MRGGVYPDLASRFDFWPVKTAEGQNAVIGLAFDPDERPSAPDALGRHRCECFSLVLDRQHDGLDAMLGPQLNREALQECNKM